MKKITETKEILQPPRNIAIISHPMPDGDAFGSMLSLARVLSHLGHQVTRISPTGWGDFLDWMPGADLILDYSTQTAEATKALDDAEIVYCLDFNEPKRIGVVAQSVFTDKHTTILIDHHLEPDVESFDYGISNPDKSSTAQMVYEYIIDMGWEQHIDEDVMVCIYTGMLTDTGSFRFSATDADVHRIVADLKDRGLEHTEIHQNLFDNNSEARMRFLGYLLAEKLTIVPELGLGYIAVSQEELKKYNVTLFDLEGIVNMILSIKGVDIAALITDRGNEVKLSLRSTGDTDVSKYMRDNFKGGGHKNAAGGRSSLNLTDSIDKLKSVLAN